MSGPRRALYVLNGFHQGGAEAGLATLLEQGFMKGADFRVLAFFCDDERLRRRIEGFVGRENVTLVSEKKRLTFLTLGAGFFVLLRILWLFRPSVVMLSLKQANIVGRAALCFFPFARCIAIEHSTRLDEKKMATLYRYLLGFLSFRVDETWADCQTTLDETDQFYIWRRKRDKRVIPLFCRPAEIKVKTQYAFSAPLRAVIAGRLIASKRHDLVLRAMADLAREGKVISLTIFGTGPQEEPLRRLSQTLGLSGCVYFMGHVENWWQQAVDFDVFVLPSEREGFCIVAAEAMMIGLPLLVTALGGLRDYSVDDVNALHLSGAPLEAVKKGLSRLYDDEPLRARLGRAGAQKIASCFSEAVVRNTLSTLTEQLGQCF